MLAFSDSSLSISVSIEVNDFLPIRSRVMLPIDFPDALKGELKTAEKYSGLSKVSSNLFISGN